MGTAFQLLSFFLFVMGTVGAILMVFRWWAAKSLESLPETPGTLAERIPPGFWGAVLRSMFFIGALTSDASTEKLPARTQLVAAGYRSPLAPTIFSGTKIASGVLLGLVLSWVGLLYAESLVAAAVLAVCGAGFGYLLPDRVLEGRVAHRSVELERALPNALDLIVLGIEAGQPLDSALFDTARELRGLYPELAEEFNQVHLELRAGRTRAEVLFNLGQRTGSQELKKLSTVLLDSDRFGTSLAPALRTHARYLRTRRRYSAQESARKLGVKLVFPVFFLIMPSVFVVTLGPALLTILETLSRGFGG
jgi:tight adherence protein C